MDRSDYVNLVKQTVNEFQLSCKSMQLRKLWSDKTGTESPKKWSEQFKTPILCMVPEADIEKAQCCFLDTLNRNQPDAGSIDKALEYLEAADFYDLEGRKARDAALGDISLRATMSF